MDENEPKDTFFLSDSDNYPSDEESMSQIKERVKKREEKENNKANEIITIDEEPQIGSDEQVKSDENTVETSDKGTEETETIDGGQKEDRNLSNSTNAAAIVENRLPIISPGAILAARLRERGKNAKFQSDVLIIPRKDPQIEDEKLKVVVTKQQAREIEKKRLMYEHGKTIMAEIKEKPNQEIQDEIFEEEEEEEEDIEENKEIMKTDIAKAAIAELQNEEAKDLTNEEVEKKLYERIVEMRLTEDLEEIKQIIRIITGQWRSGRLRYENLTEEGLNKAFEGNEKENKELEMKRKMRRQRKKEEKRITSETISNIIEKAMWVQAGTSEEASVSDKLRGELAKVGNNDPRKEILERLEMNAFLQERRAQESLNERRKRNNKLTRVDRTSITSFSPSELNLKASDISKKKSSFSFIINDKIEQEYKSPTKQIEEKPIKQSKANKKLHALLNKLNE